ncbi:MAG TPA: LptA/OstA family protein [Bryobacteraceae bacterium]|nr:LptA/OstA family protein [Bryobacteraceae bacterium]
MRGTRWLLLVAIAAILGGIGFTYRNQKRMALEAAPPRPKELAEGLHASAECWEFTDTDAKNHNRVTADVSAVDMREVKDSSRTELGALTLRLPSRKGDSYNLVKCVQATFFKEDHRLYCEGDARITLNVPGAVQLGTTQSCRIDEQTEIQAAEARAGQPRHKLVTIETSGLTMDTENHRAETDRPSTFHFERGEGKATGAIYDPETHELQMKSDVEVHYTPESPNAKPMLIQAGGLKYDESTSAIALNPWGRLIRETMTVEGENPLIQLQDHKEIRHVHAYHAHGSDELPTRKVQYAADELWMDFNEHGEVEKISAQGNARLVSASESAETTVTAYHVDLDFQVQNHESLLTRVIANGNGVVTERPLPVPGRELAETHVLKSDSLEMKMRPGGRELEQLVTEGRGNLEFQPNLPAQHHRILTGDNMRIAYGPQNRIDSFHAVNVHTVTDPNAEEKKRSRAQSVTDSKDLAARFDPQRSQLTAMEQTGDFSYTEGDRQARATRATLDQAQNVIVLDGNAKMWDTTGSTAADRIRMDQRTGDFTAEGNVNSSRMPEKDAQKNSQMLSSDEPLQAQARRMVSTNHNHNIHYEGNVLMWQGANRISADAIDVERDRDKRNLIADGHVVSNLWEQPKDDAKKTGQPVLTVVHAPHLAYNDTTRLAVYSGGVDLVRSKMRVKSKELKAYLAESSADSRLEKAFADGSVVIVDTEPDRVRTGTGEHGEYYTADQKVVLTGGRPKFSDNLGNSLEGAKLTYNADTGRLQSDGPANQPVESRILRKSKGK